MGRTIAFVSGKGGTGKSTVVCNLGVALSERGKKTVVVDADLTMADVALMLGLQDKEPTLHEVLAGKVGIEKAIYKSFQGLNVVPCGLSLAGVEQMRPERLVFVVKKLSEKFEFVLLDCPSGFGEDAMASLNAAEEAILVLNPDLPSVTNALNAKAQLEKTGVRLLGMVLNRVGKWGISAKHVASTVGLPVLAEIPEDLEVPRATSVGEPVVIFSPRSPASKAFARLAEVVISGGGHKKGTG